MSIPVTRLAFIKNRSNGGWIHINITDMMKIGLPIGKTTVFKHPYRLGFIALSIVYLSRAGAAVAATIDPGSVEQLRNEAIEFARKEDAKEPVQRMMDAVCLAELLKVPETEQIALLLKSAGMTSIRIGAPRLPVLSGQYPELSQYCAGEILKKTRIRTFEDLAPLKHLALSAMYVSDAERKRLLSEVLSLQLKTNEERRQQVLVSLQLCNQASGAGAYLMRAYEMAKQLEPPDVGWQRNALDKLLSTSYDYRKPEEFKRLRTALEAALTLPPDPDMNRQYPQTEAALHTMMTHDDAASMVTMCEKQAEISSRVFADFPKHRAPSQLYRGWAYLAAGRGEDALKTFLTVIDLLRPDGDQDFAFAQLSAAQAELKLGRKAEAKTRLLELRAFFHDPKLADSFHYGAIGEAMLGELYESEGNQDAARICYETADSGLMLMADGGYSEMYRILSVKKTLPDDLRVLERLSTIYKNLNLPEKVKEAQLNLTKMKRMEVAKVNSQREAEVGKIALNPGKFARTEILGEPQRYLQFMLASEDNTELLSGRLLGLSMIYLQRDLVDDASNFLLKAKEVSKLQTSNDVLFQRNWAWSLWQKGMFEPSLDVLNNITTRDTMNLDEKFVAKWLLAKNYNSLKQTVKALELYEDVSRNWKPSNQYELFQLTANCEYAELLISRSDYKKAETLLKKFLSEGESNWQYRNYGELSGLAYPLALLAKAQVLSNKPAEAQINLTASLAAQISPSEYGIQAAFTRKAMADATLALKDTARARRLYFEAYRKFNDLEHYSAQAEVCRREVQKLLPAGAPIVGS